MTFYLFSRQNAENQTRDRDKELWSQETEVGSILFLDSFPGERGCEDLCEGDLGEWRQGKHTCNNRNRWTQSLILEVSLLL